MRGVVVCLAIGVAATAAAQEESVAAATPEPLSGPTYSAGNNWQWTVFPATNLYERYVADPRAPVMNISYLYVLDSDIDMVSRQLTVISLGGRARFLRLHPRGRPDLGFQFSVEAGFMGRFDLVRKADAIGWDGYYGLRFTYKPNDRFEFKL